jgi:hypothetical protein
MFCNVLAIDKNVIKKYQDETPQKFRENRVHEFLKTGWSICQAERHYQVFIVTKMCPKSSFCYVCRIHAYLVISRTQIKFGKYLGPVEFIK